jgi:hypothetical protein
MQPLEAAVFVTINPSLNLHPERAFPYPLPVVHVLSVLQDNESILRHYYTISSRHLVRMRDR